MKRKDEKVKDGALAALYVGILLASAYFVPAVWAFLENRLSWHSLLPQLLALFLFALSAKLLFREPFRIPYFLAVALLFFYAMSRLELPVERIHFIEYGTLSFFLFRVLRHFFRVPWSFIGSALIASGIGVIDELLQGLLPNRTYDTRDLWINFFSASLGMLVVATWVTPRSF